MCVFVLIYAKNGPKMVVKYKTDVRQLKRYCTGLWESQLVQLVTRWNLRPHTF